MQNGTPNQARITPVFTLDFIQSQFERRARSDPAFLELALRDVQSAFRIVTGFELPCSFLLEQSDGLISMSIPLHCYQRSHYGVEFVQTEDWRMVLPISEADVDSSTERFDDSGEIDH